MDGEVAMSTEVHIEIITEFSEEVFAALENLVPQLSSSAKALDKDFIAGIISSAASNLLVARDESGTILGSLTLAVFTIPTGVRAWIEDVVVDGNARGLGVGQQLSEVALDVAKAAGARTVELTSRPSREAANKLYAKIGFEVRETNVYRYSFD